MIHILLVCSAGMSTSFLVNKMEASAVEKGVEVHIWAVADVEASTHIPNADIVMLGPQVRFLEKKMKEVAGNKPVCVIDMMAYGTMDGKKVLQQALHELKTQ